MNQKRRFPFKALISILVVAGVAAALVFRFVLRELPVDVAEVAEGVIEEEVKGPGRTSSHTEVNVSSRIVSAVEEVLAQEGDRVVAGQLLARLDGRDLEAKAAAARSAVAAAEQNVLVAKAALQRSVADLALARSNFKRDKEVFLAGHLSKAAFDTATAVQRVAVSAKNNAAAVVGAREEEVRRAESEASFADTIQSHTEVVSPIAGLITRRQVEVGNTVAPGGTLFKVVDDQTVCIATRIDVSQMGRVDLGQRARIRLASGGEAPGSVVRISHESDPVTRDQEVRVRFDVPPKRITLGEEAEVVISVGQARGLVIPGSAVLPIDGTDGVLLVRDGRAERVTVEIGAVGQGRILVSQGLSAGDRVIIHPETAKTGQRVRPDLVED